MEARRARVLVAAVLGVLALNAVGAAVALRQDVRCEFDCVGGEPRAGFAGAMLQGTAYNAPLPMLALVVLAALLATRRDRRVATGGAILTALAGMVMLGATVGEPWVRRALADADGMTLAAAAFLGAAAWLLAAGAVAARRAALSR